MTENGKDAWAIARAKCQFGSKLKISKRCEKRLYDHIKVVVCKNPLQKTPNIRKVRAF